jgi:acyl dehydratase
MSDISVGQSASVSKAFSEAEVLAFANLSLDHNPVHIDPEYAAQTMFGKQIVHGMLVSSLFSGLLGQKLPGEGTIYLGQNLSFKKPIFIDQNVTASVEVTDVRTDKPIITLKTTCVDDDGQVLVSGEAVVMYKPV